MKDGLCARRARLPLTHEGVLVTVREEPVHLFIRHHVVGEVQHGEVQPVVTPLVKDDLARFCGPVFVGAVAPEDPEDGVVSCGE
jgi:hypothetical protein